MKNNLHHLTLKYGFYTYFYATHLLRILLIFTTRQILWPFFLLCMRKRKRSEVIQWILGGRTKGWRLFNWQLGLDDDAALLRTFPHLLSSYLNSFVFWFWIFTWRAQSLTITTTTTKSGRVKRCKSNNKGTENERLTEWEQQQQQQRNTPNDKLLGNLT